MNIHVKLLTRAKELIEGRYERYICHALDDVYYEPEAAEISGLVDLKDRIGRELGDYAFLDDWVRANAGIEMTSHQARLARMAWIDKLIEEYSDEPT